MKKTRVSPKRKVQAESMPEVDFSKGVRGKYYQRLREEGFTVRIDPSPVKDVRPRKAARSAPGR